MPDVIQDLELHQASELDVHGPAELPAYLSQTLPVSWCMGTLIAGTMLVSRCRRAYRNHHGVARAKRGPK
jgi:hypothetical protein